MEFCKIGKCDEEWMIMASNGIKVGKLNERRGSMKGE